MKNHSIYKYFTPGLFPTAVESPNSMIFVFHHDELLVHKTNTSYTIPVRDKLPFSNNGSLPKHYLGKWQTSHCFALGLNEKPGLSSRFEWSSLRKASVLLEHDLWVLAGRAFQIIEWDRTHQFCGRCGVQTEPAKQARAKKCPQCGLMSFPRLSPAIIVRITDGDKILLGRGKHFPPQMYSVLAGFVDAGENLEEAVERELLEEVNIRVKNLHYFGSQPWPFPNSLMIAFTAEYASGTLNVDHHELEDAKWFSYNRLPKLPPPMSIARQLIDDFLA